MPVRSLSLKAASLKAAVAALVVSGVLSGIAGMGVASAEPRDPAYAAARAAGQVGEKMDGYLGIVGGATPALRGMVDDLNIKRRAVYSQKAQAQRVTVEEYAFTSGCLLIAQTTAGEKYQAPGGGWQTRTGAPPQRDPRCP